MQIPGLGSLGSIGAVIGGPAAFTLFFTYYAWRKYNSLTPLEKKALHQSIERLIQKSYDNTCVRMILGRFITLPSIEELKIKKLIEEIETIEAIALTKVKLLEEEVKDDAKKINRANTKLLVAKTNFEEAQKSGIEERIKLAQTYLVLRQKILLDQKALLAEKKQELERARASANIIHDKILLMHEGVYGDDIMEEVRAIEAREGDIENQEDSKEDEDETKSEEERAIKIGVLRPIQENMALEEKTSNSEPPNNMRPNHSRVYRPEDQDLARQEMQLWELERGGHNTPPDTSETQTELEEEPNLSLWYSVLLDNIGGYEQ